MKVYIMLKRTIARYAQKAVDKVWHEGIFIKLFEMGIDLYLWKIVVRLRDTNLSSYVLFRSFKSSAASNHQNSIFHEA